MKIVYNNRLKNITKGRHIILVAARNRNAAPDVSLTIRELGVPAGGHIKILMPANPK